MIFLSSGQSWQQHLALGKFPLIHFVTEIQIPYFSFASLQINDPCNKDGLSRSGFFKQIKRNNKAKTQDWELSLKGGRALHLYLLFFLLVWRCCHVLLHRPCIWYYFTYQEYRQSVLLGAEESWIFKALCFIIEMISMQKLCKVVYEHAYKKKKSWTL